MKNNNSGQQNPNKIIGAVGGSRFRAMSLFKDLEVPAFAGMTSAVGGEEIPAFAGIGSGNLSLLINQFPLVGVINNQVL